MEKQFTFRKLDYKNLGFIDYKEAWDLQKETLDKRVKKEIEDTLYLLEHPHTYTLGKIADKNNLISTEKYLKSRGISVYEIDRGGDITYHGPGQIVGYPIMHLTDWKQDTHLYLRTLEEVIIKTLEHYGIKAGRKDGLTGVWLDDRKICAMGIKVSRWVTMHGFALNVSPDLSYFGGIIPCGIKDKAVTSLEKELESPLDIEEVKTVILENFIEQFGYTELLEKD